MQLSDYSAAQLRQLDDWLDLLLDLPQAEQEPTLLDLTTASLELRAPLRELLAASMRTGVLDTPLWDVAPDVSEAAALGPGTRIGAWEILAAAARGGMACVYRGQRADGAYQQQVAIKVLEGSHPRQVAGLARERALLARLEHPHIARLLDGGVLPGGTPWLVMAWVEGEDLDAWLRRCRPDLAVRLNLFQQIAAAVAHAHRHLILHRDLKPANVRVTPAGQAVLLDFGIARPEDVPAEHTQTQLTPAYAAPEQLAGQPGSVATDVHGLGLLLFELLTGVHAWPDARDSLSAAVQAICQREAPRLSASSSAELGIAARRLRGDLDAIVGKALAKRPADRYVSVDALLADLERHRTHRPVLARQMGGWARLGRWWRRHWLPAGLALAALLGTGSGAVLAWQAAVLARAERDQAQVQARRQEALREHLMLVFREGAAQGGAATSKELLDASAALLDRLYAQDPEQRRGVLLALGELYFSLGDYAASRALVERFLASELRTLDPADLDTALLQRINLDIRQGKLEDAAHHLDALPARSPGVVDQGAVQRLALRSALLRAQGQAVEGLALQQQAADAADLARDLTPLERGVVWSNLGVAQLQAGQIDAARYSLKHALEVWQSAGQEQSSNALTTRMQLATAEVLSGAWQAADVHYTELVEAYAQRPPSATRAAALHNHGRVLLNLHRLEAAGSRLQAALDMAERTTGTDGMDASSYRLTLAEWQFLSGARVAAQDTAQRARAGLLALLGETHPVLARADLLLAWLAGQQGDPQARTRMREAIRRLSAAPPLLQRQAMRGSLWLAELELAAGESRQAAETLEAAAAWPVLSQLAAWERVELDCWRARAGAAVGCELAVLSAALGSEHPRVQVLRPTP